MQLLYFKAKKGNFGDDLNPWLWPLAIPNFASRSSDTTFLGIGTILDDTIPVSAKLVVFGTGVRYPGPTAIPASTWRIFGLRGPLSCERLNLPSQMAIGDPGYLVPDYFDRTRAEHHGRVLFIPHISSTRSGEEFLANGADKAGVSYLSPHTPVCDVLQRIAGADRVITESLHGAILADAFRVPWLAVQSSRHADRGASGAYGFKWRDWAASINIKYSPFLFDMRPRLPLLSFLKDKIHATTAGVAVSRRLRQLASSRDFRLSEAGIIRAIVEKQRATLSSLLTFI